MKKVHLYGNQKIKVRDFSVQKTFVTKDRYCFELDSEEIERICRLKVNSFEIDDQKMLVINAE